METVGEVVGEIVNIEGNGIALDGNNRTSAVVVRIVGINDDDFRSRPEATTTGMIRVVG